MKNKRAWIIVGLSAATAGYAIARRRRIGLAEKRAWIKQRRPALDVLACPVCHGKLALIPIPEGEGYR
jgi:hypothetical protein